MTAYELMMQAQREAAQSQPQPQPQPKPQAQTPLAQAVRAVDKAQEISKLTEDVLSRGMLVAFSCPIPGNDKVDQGVTEKVKADQHLGKDSGKWNKTVFPPARYRTISKLAAAIRTWHYEQTLPWPMPGQQLLTTMKHEEYMTGMRERKAQMAKAQEDFIAALPEMREWAKKEHNGSFDSSLYEEERVRSKFRFDIILMPIPSSSHWVGQLRNLVGTDVEGVDELVEQGMIEAESAVWERLETPLRSIINVLGKKQSGDRTKVTDALLENILAIADAIPALNVNGNAKLARLAADAKAAFSGLTKQDLTEDADKRKAALKAADEIMQRMKGIV